MRRAHLLSCLALGMLGLLPGRATAQATDTASAETETETETETDDAGAEAARGDEARSRKPTRFSWLYCDDGTDRSQGWLRHFADEEGDHRVYDLNCDVGWHKPIYILPYTYSRDYEGDATEVLFQVSAKLRPTGLPLYFAYSQRSFWELYDESDSRPFRETVYNPEVFWRWFPRQAPPSGLSWGADLGYEHESNGQELPDSRSWDRLYVAPFIERGGTAAQLKVWFRFPEDRKEDELDARGDDNPDIERHYGYAEFNLYRRIGDRRRIHLMLRGNPSSGHGAIQLAHDWRIGGGDLFWHAYLWHGYGESLTDYNDSVTRVGVGFSMAR